MNIHFSVPAADTGFRTAIVRRLFSSDLKARSESRVSRSIWPSVSGVWGF